MSRSSLVSVPGFLSAFLVLLSVSALTVILYNARDSHHKIRIAINVWPGYEYLFLARDLGFFEDEGLEIELVEVGNLTDVRRAYVEGNTDGMASTLVEVIEACRHTGRRPHIVLVTDYSNGSDVLLARRDIATIEQLRKRRIGTEPASLGMFLLSRALETRGLSLRDVEIVPMLQDDMLDALKTGIVDAVTTFPPVSIHIRQQTDAEVLFDSSQIPGEIIDVITLDERVLRAHPGIIPAFHRAWTKTMRYVEENPEKAYPMLVRRMEISATEFIDSLAEMELLGADDQSRYLSPDESPIPGIMMNIAGSMSPRPPGGETPPPHSAMPGLDACSAIASSPAPPGPVNVAGPEASKGSGS